MAEFAHVTARSCAVRRVEIMASVRRPKPRIPWLLLPLLCALAARPGAAAGTGDLAQFLGTWHGTSTCVDRQVAPACKDETVVYEVVRSDKPQAVVLKADRIVDGKRVPMGDLEFTFSEKQGCWRSEFTTPRVQGVWCLVVEGKKLSGGLRVSPENAVVRKVELSRD